MNSQMRVFLHGPMAAFLLGSAVAVATGCTAATAGSGFDSSSPREKINAIERAGRHGSCDHDTLLRLIEQLDSDDPAVRLVAIATLRRITGETHGYVHYAPRYERNLAIARWIEATQAETERGDADG